MKYYTYDTDVNYFASIELSTDEDDPLHMLRLHRADAPLADHWVVPAVRWLEDDAKPEGDFPTLSNYSRFPVMSQRAWDALRPLIGYCCEALPITFPRGNPYLLIHVMETVDALDIPKSCINRSSSGRISRIFGYALKQSVLRGKHIFKLPPDCGADLMVDEEFRRIVEAHGLKGLLFEELRTPSEARAWVAEKRRSAAASNAAWEKMWRDRRLAREQSGIPAFAPAEHLNQVAPAGCAPMDELDDRIWEAILADPHNEVDPPASPEAMAAFENECDFVLPPRHRAFLLMRTNGGAIGVARLFGVGRGDGIDLGYQVFDWRPGLESMADGPVFPFANTWGGSYFCDDLTARDASGDFPVLYWDHEKAESGKRSPKLWSPYAPDFRGFLQKAISFPE